MSRDNKNAKRSWDHLYNNIGKQIRIRRLEANITQEELAQRMGLTRTSITNIESGRQKILVHSLYEFAQALGISPYALLPSIEIRDSLDFKKKLPKTLKPEQRDWINRVWNLEG